MKRVGLGILVGAVGAAVSIGACALDESGSASDGGPTLDVTTDVQIDGGGPDVGQDAPQDVAYDIPDLGVFETESGPCTCVASVPSGYTVVEYVPNQRPTCTTGYASSNDYVENPTAQPSTCTCTCGSTPLTGSCSCGTDPATFNISSGNGNCTDVTNENVQANVGSCYKTGQTLNPNGNKLNNMLAAPATPCTAAGTCGTPSKVTNIPTASVEQGRSCALTAATTTCTGGTCIPDQGTPFSMCVTNQKSDPCPSSFPITHVVGASVSDTRACVGQCTTCTLVDAGTCGVPQLLLYSGDNNCGGNGSSVTIPADNSTCTNAGYGNGTTFDSAHYTISHAGGACAFTGSFGASGSLGVTGPFHVCCR
jgi:hypothetical protein